MNKSKPNEWIYMIINRFEDELPCRNGSKTAQSETNLNNFRQWLINASKWRFSVVFPAIVKILTRLSGETVAAKVPGSDAEKLVHESLIVVIDTLEQCLLNLPKDATRLDETMNVKLLLREICQFIVADGNLENQNSCQLKSTACDVLFTISKIFDTVVFNKISGRLEELTVCTEENPDYGELELIQHISIDTALLIRLLADIVQKFKALKKSAHFPLINSLEIAIWKWMSLHPDEFGEIQESPNEELAKYCEMLFDFLDNCAESRKGRSYIWSLQLLLLLLSPKLMEEIVNADSGAPWSPQHSRKKLFMDTMKRAVNVQATSNKQNVESSTIVLAKLCKASTYINIYRSNNVVFTLVQSVINDLKALMFNGSRPFLRGQLYFSQDVEVLTEFFISCFRLKPHNTDVLKVCLNPVSSGIYQYVLICSLHRITTETRLPWWPTVDLFYNKSYEFRSMFTDTLNKVTRSLMSHTPLRMIQSLTLKSKESSCKFRDRAEDVSSHKLLLMMVRLIRADPMLMLYNQDKPGHEIQSCTLELINGLVSLVYQTVMMDVAQEAMEALLVLHEPGKIELWNPEAPINTFWDVSSQVLFSISQKMIQHQIVNYTDILKWLEQILIRRNDFLSRHKEYANVGTHIPICKQAQIKLEAVFLVYLWSLENEAVYVSLSCFQLLCEEADIRCASGELEVSSLLPNYFTYEELAQISCLDVDRSVLQKRILSVLRQLKYCVNGLQPAWEETFQNWEVATTQISTSPKFKGEEFPLEACHRSLTRRRASQQNTEFDIEDQIQEWAYMTGFLCSVGGVMLNNKNSSKISSDSEISKLLALSTSNQDIQYYPVIQFINQLLKLLLSSGERYGILIQKHVKELMGHEMSLMLYPILFDQIKIVVERFFDHQGQAVITQGNTQFIEQIVYVMKIILERKVEEPFENFGSTSIDGIIITIVRYVRQLDISTNTITLKTKICQLVGAIIRRRDDLSFRHEMKFRNKMVDYLSDWIIGFSYHIPCSTPNAPPFIMNRELNQSVVEALCGLLSGLPLQAEEVEGCDINVAKSQLFLKYFSLLMKLLYDCVDASVQISVNSPREVNEQNEMGNLRGMIILVLTNLLSANIDSGLIHTVVATHHSGEVGAPKADSIMSSSENTQTNAMFEKDIQGRIAVMEVLIKVLQQGAEFNMLADSVLADRYEQLVQLVTMISDRGDLPIAMALANVVTSSQMDELARVFVTIFESKHLLSPLLWNMFYREVEVSDCMQTLFRGNSLGSKIMAFCFKIYGSDYLSGLLAPLIQPLLTDAESRGYEVDPTRLSSEEDIEQNRQVLIELTQTVFNSIVSSAPSFPPQLRSMCHCLYQVLSERFPQVPHSNVTSVGTVIFLRFINPAIVSPQEFGVIKEVVPSNIKRGLMLISKILQNIANHVEFTKEPHMMPFNDFLKCHFESARRFFIQIASDCETENQPPPTMSFCSDINVHALHRLLHNHQEKISEYLSNSRDYKAIGRRPFDKLATLLAYLGPPEYKYSEVQLNSLDMPCCIYEGNSNQSWLCVEEYNSIKNLNIFYQYGISKAGNPVFYFIARKFKNMEINNESFMIFVIQTLRPHHHSPFELFIDFTHVGGDNRFATSYLKNWMCIRGIHLKNLVFTYAYNCNTWVKEYTKFHESILAPIKSYRNIVFLETLNKVADYISPSQQKIPGAMFALEEDLKVFNGALKLSRKDTKVAIKIGSSVLQIMQMEKTKVLNHSVLLNDVYYASEIEEVCLIDDNQFTLTTRNESTPLSFIYSDCNSVIRSLIHIRNRWEMSQPDSVGVHHKIKSKDVPGILLNTALYNLGSRDANLRVVSYNLLCALTAKFDLKIEGKLMPAASLCIPFNNTIFIKGVSQNLANNENRLTLEFLDEVIYSFQISNIEMKHLCLEYMTPWLPNLAKFHKSSDQTKKQRVVQILNKLITLTIKEEELSPSIQSKIWCSIGKVSEMIDVVIECFLQESTKSGVGSRIVDTLADTAVALASVNVDLIAKNIINRLLWVFDQTNLTPITTLEEHSLWINIIILSRYLLMLSFNNCLNVVQNVPELFHVVTVLVNCGPLHMKATIHCLVVNTIHSLCMCNKPAFSVETRQILQMCLDEFSIRKYYTLFGISEVEYATVTAFRYNLRPNVHSKLHRRDCESGESILTPYFSETRKSFYESVKLSAGKIEDIDLSEKALDKKASDDLSLSSLDTITTILAEIAEACMNNLGVDWLARWTELAKRHAFFYNAALQPRALIVYGCICKKVDDEDIRQLLRILCKELRKATDLSVIEASVLCLTGLLHFLRQESRLHGFLFWVGISLLQLGDEQLFEAGLGLIEQNLLFLNSNGIFDDKSLKVFMMSAREPLEESYFRTMDGDIGLSFKDNFHFALVGHLIKGFRHPSQATVSRTMHLLISLLGIIAKPYRRDKFEVTLDSVAYLSALVSISEEVRNRCHMKYVQSSVGVADSQRQVDDHTSPTDFVEQHEPWEIIESNGYEREQDSQVRRDRASVSNENNVLLNPDILTDSTVQVLTITLLTTLAKYATNEDELVILCEYLAEGSIVFSKVFRVIYNLLDAKLIFISQTSNNEKLLRSMQNIILNMIVSEDSSQDHLHYIHTCGFRGLWRFAGPFNKSNQAVLGPGMFANYLEAIVDNVLLTVEDETSSSDDTSKISLNTSGSFTEKDQNGTTC